MHFQSFFWHIQIRQSNIYPVVFLFGPTAVGKTKLLTTLFSDGYEIVSADSVQVYRHLDIGSAKADAAERKAVRHHLIDILDPWEHYSVSDFVTLADSACEDIVSRGRIPVISGGTAFYFKTFLYGLSQAPPSNPVTRSEVESLIKSIGLKRAHEYLQQIDSVSASRINVNDSYRISRAIEVFKDSGKPLSSFELPKHSRKDFNVISIGLCRDKSALDNRIRQRVDLMFNMGILDEIKSLLDMGANSQWQSMQGIGYREFISAIESGVSIENIDTECIKEEIAINSIHYAKRQMTFFRSFSDVIWCDAQNIESVRCAVDSFISGTV